MVFNHTNLPSEEDYPKLVRDRIVEIIEKRGEKAEWDTIITNEEFLKYLLKKLGEESTEAKHSLVKGNLEEELADVMEIVDEILKLKKWEMKDIRKLQKEKREKNGGFEKRIKLIKP